MILEDSPNDLMFFLKEMIACEFSTSTPEYVGVFQAERECAAFRFDPLWCMLVLTHSKPLSWPRFLPSGVHSLLLSEDDDNPRYSQSQKYWYYENDGNVYDYDLHYLVGRISKIDNIPNKLDKNTYIIDYVVNIPILYNN